MNQRVKLRTDFFKGTHYELVMVACKSCSTVVSRDDFWCRRLDKQLIKMLTLLHHDQEECHNNKEYSTVIHITGK
ncbi:MAG TPA: hypothetical protein VHK27_03200 [Gammaproteobacteria bacterium]|nr:hypothetical protein [Gammaproteobacteria bacterium]